MYKQALQYIKNTNGGVTKANFIEDHEPIGHTLWVELHGMIREDENGRIWLTEAGKAQLREYNGRDKNHTYT